VREKNSVDAVSQLLPLKGGVVSDILELGVRVVREEHVFVLYNDRAGQI